MASFSSSPRKHTSSQVEFEDLSSITHPAIVHAGVTSFSPMREVFCWIHVRQQEKAKICRVPADKQERLTEIAKEDDPIVLSNCSVKARSGDSLEIIVHDQTQFDKSPKKFELNVKKVFVEDTSVSKCIS